MGARSRTYALVAIAAAAAVGLVLATVAFTRTTTPPAAKPLSGSPRLLLDLGLRADPEARALRRAAALYDDRRPDAAERIFRRYRSLQARVGAAFAAWPDGAADKLEQLARDHPRSSFVQLHLGLARYWLRDDAGATRAWRAAARLQPDTASAVHAEDLLHPQFVPGLPMFVTSRPYPRALAKLPAQRQLRALAAAARAGDVQARLFYGVVLQRLGRPLSAERQFAAAARAAPTDPEALTAAAVGRFSKTNPSAAFSRLGPLARRFPRAQTIRFHLGLLLLYLNQVPRAREELRLARSLGPRTQLGRDADAFVRRLGPNSGN